ncbi:MAG: serine/threonine-protein phosphatase [Candidatus Dadabacteria bacterium]|nr:MAG: serine/threonine-protein phosphatase [Candidatus Dadabacteria bacterium]
MLLEGLNNQGNFDVDASDNPRIPAAITDTGCERDLNEDRYAVIESPSGLAWLVCDGMGGESGGELAAQLAIDAMQRDFQNLPARDPAAALRSAILEANRIIVLRRQNQAFAQMGTTVVGALFAGAEVVIGHCGDSRAYLVRDGAIQQLTTDHTYVQELVDAGKIRPEEALSHPQAHILTRCIGSEPALEVDLQRYWIWSMPEDQPTDFLVLSTDGLYSLVTEGEIANIVSQSTPQRACVKLVEMAKSRGGFDNITLAVIPLGGQLRQEPPEGYTGTYTLQKQRAVKKKGPLARMSAIKFGVITFIFTALAVLAAIVISLVTVKFGG